MGEKVYENTSNVVQTLKTVFQNTLPNSSYVAGSKKVNQKSNIGQRLWFYSIYR